MAVTNLRRKSTRGAISWRILVPVLLLIAGAIAAGVIFVPKILDDSAPVTEETNEEPAPTGEEFINDDGGYSFEHPPDWQVASDGSVSDVESPDNEAIVSFGIAPEGDLLVASDRLMALLRESYEGFELAEEDVQSFGNDLAMVRSGTAASGNEDLRFQTVVIKTSEGNYAITSFATENEGVRYMTDIDTMMRSFDIVE
jgi:hypothetical protein